jgi:hypothetical protein
MWALCIVNYAWIENGGRGFAELNLFTGPVDDPTLHTFYLNRTRAVRLAVGLSEAVAKGLGKMPKSRAREDELMEAEICLELEDINIGLGRPNQCQIKADDSTVKIVTKFGGRAVVTCASAASAIELTDQLLNNVVSTVHRSSEVLKITFQQGDTINACGLTDGELAELDRQHARVCEWRLKR